MSAMKKYQVAIKYVLIPLEAILAFVRMGIN